MSDPTRPADAGLALVTGATGYIGGRLVEPLLQAGRPVRVLTRAASRLDPHPWREHVEVVQGDAGDEADLSAAMDGVDVAYYFLHSMDGRADFAQRDRDLAATFARVAQRSGVRRIVYLGGMHPSGEELSAHLASRTEVGQIFLDGAVPAVCLQAAVILGDGSASFTMLRYLTERLPIMVAPKWLRNRIQPIAVEDVLRYLVAAADLDADVNRTFDIGGPEVMTYAQMIRRFAAVTGLSRRLVIILPFLTPELASHWVGLMTPLSAGLARPLVHSLIHEVVCQERDIAQYVPDPPGGLIGFDDAVRDAMDTAAPASPPSLRTNLAFTAAATAGAAALGSVATDPDSRWYRHLELPPWQPPRAAFPLVWTGLYGDIAWTSAKALTTLDHDHRPADARALRWSLAGNLVLNAAWSALFFRLRRPWVATAGAAALTVSSAELTTRVHAAHPLAGRADMTS